MACYLMGVEKNEKEIANVTNISPQTVKNAYRELYQARHQVTAGITAKVLVDDIENPLTSL
jgi:transcription initiation factor TFIIIB Brf1 subunit/transcription initiation factor TFIIB